MVNVGSLTVDYDILGCPLSVCLSVCLCLCLSLFMLSQNEMCLEFY